VDNRYIRAAWQQCDAGDSLCLMNQPNPVGIPFVECCRVEMLNFIYDPCGPLLLSGEVDGEAQQGLLCRALEKSRAEWIG